MKINEKAALKNETSRSNSPESWWIVQFTPQKESVPYSVTREFISYVH